MAIEKANNLVKPVDSVNTLTDIYNATVTALLTQHDTAGAHKSTGDLVLKTLFDANTILVANSDDTPAALTIAASQIVGRASTGNIAALTAAQVNTILGTVIKTDFDANTILAANTDNVPAALTIAEQRLVGRITGGNIVGLTAAQTLTLLGLDSNLADLTSGEITQLEAIGTTTISAAQWGYLGGLDQALAQASTPTFAGASLDGAVTVNNSEADKDFRIAALNITNAFLVDGALGKVFLNDTTNAKAAGPSLTINQGGADDEILTLKSSDVTHGMTGRTEADTYAMFAKTVGATGGLTLTGLSTAAAGGGGSVIVRGFHENAIDTTKSAAGVGAIRLEAAIKSGVSVTAAGADQNLVVILNWGTARFIFDAEGSAHAEVEWVAFQEEDDLALLADFETAMLVHQNKIKDGFVDFLRYKRKDLEEAKIVHFDDDNPGHAMVNFTRLSMLQVGALQQLNSKCKFYERAFEKLGISQKELLALEV